MRKSSPQNFHLNQFLKPCFGVIFVLSNHIPKTAYYAGSTQPSILFLLTKWVAWNPEDLKQTVNVTRQSRQ